MGFPGTVLYKTRAKVISHSIAISYHDNVSFVQNKIKVDWNLKQLQIQYKLRPFAPLVQVE